MGKWCIGIVLAWSSLALESGCAHKESPETREHKQLQLKPWESFEKCDAKLQSFTRKELTKVRNGLSSLAAFSSKELWATSERIKSGQKHMAYRFELPSDGNITRNDFEIHGLPPELEEAQLEGISILRSTSDGSAKNFVISAEKGKSSIYFHATLEENKINAKDPIYISKFDPEKKLTADSLLKDSHRITIEDDKGAEGLCGDNNYLLVGLESIQETKNDRWAPLLLIREDKISKIYELPLKSGRLSSLDCSVDESGNIRGLALVRDFGLRKILYFSLSPTNNQVRLKEDSSRGTNTFKEVADLSEKFPQQCTTEEEKRIDKKRCGPNLEGIALAPDCTIYLINDNQDGWNTNNRLNELFISK